MKGFNLFLLFVFLQLQVEAQLDDKNDTTIDNTFLYDSLGRLRIDTSKSILSTELKQIKNNRELISAQIISALHDYELELIKRNFEKVGNEIFKLLPYQIKDTTRHLYQITCDSSGIQNIEHTLLSNNNYYGSISDSIIRKSFPSIFPYLKIMDDQIHQYFIPIIYIPNRYKRTKTFSYYCNCHFVPNNIDHINLACKNTKNQQSTLGVPYNNGFMKKDANSIWDEYYFVIADGHPWSLGPSNPVAIPRHEIVPKTKKKKKRKRKNKSD